MSPLAVVAVWAKARISMVQVAVTLKERIVFAGEQVPRRAGYTYARGQLDAVVQVLSFATVATKEPPLPAVISEEQATPVQAAGLPLVHLTH